MVPTTITKLTNLPPSKPISNRLYKNGRRTGYTEGSYNRLSECLIAEVTNGDEVTHEATMEHCVTVGYADGPFSLAGDSGALVFNVFGQVVGLLFGGAEQHSRSYFTHVDDLFGDIKEKVGATDIRIAV